MNSIDLNCDMAEGMPYDAGIMPYISSANIACGYHAGDEDVMRRTIAIALEHGVSVGAHPGFADRENFGRKAVLLGEEKYHELIIEQLSIMKKIAGEFGAPIHHVKPHGALYNMAAADKRLAKIIARAIKQFDERLILYALSGSHLIEEAKTIGLKTASEVFADRTYGDDGMLTARNEPNALITDETASVRQVLQMIEEQTVTSVNQHKVPIIAETVCIHGDGDHPAALAQFIHQTLKDHKIVIKAI